MMLYLKYLYQITLINYKNIDQLGVSQEQHILYKQIKNTILTYFQIEKLQKIKRNNKQTKQQFKNQESIIQQSLIDFYNLYIYQKTRMSLIYSLCARGNQTVLANYSPFSGNFQTIAIDVLRKLNLSKTYGQYGTAKYNFYSFIKEGFVFLVMVQVQYEMRIAIAFLRDIQEIFFRKYPKQRRDQAVAYSLSDFKQTLQERIALFNDKAKVDKFCALQKQLSEAEQISLRNLDKAIDRGERIQILVKKTQVMAETSYDMNQQAKTVKRTMWWKNKKLMIGIILLVLLIIFILVWIICGGRFQKCR